MNLRELEYIVAIADQGQFGRAASACHVSQSTLSIQVKKLEEFLGAPIFERDNRRVLTTPVGQRIIERARVILQEIREIRALAGASHDPLAGEVRLGVIPTLAAYLLPRIVPALTAALPRLRILLVEEKTPVLLDALVKGEMDAAILALPTPGSEVFSSRVLFEDEFFLAVPTGHRLAKSKSVNEASLAGEDLLLLEDGHCLRDQALEICSRVGTGERRDFRATSLETLRHMVASGGGITLIPKIAAHDQEGLRYIPFRGARRPSRMIGVVWRPTTVRAQALEKLTNTLVQAAKVFAA